MSFSGQASGRFVIRAAIGLFAGLVLGLIIETLFFWPDDPDLDPKHIILRFGRSRVPLVGPAIASATCALLAAIAGGLEIRGLLKHTVVGALIGMVVGGVVVGGILFPPFAIAIMAPQLPTKAYASYRLAGMSTGIPLGALLGLAIGTGYYSLVRNRRLARLNTR